MYLILKLLLKKHKSMNKEINKNFISSMTRECNFSQGISSLACTVLFSTAELLVHLGLNTLKNILVPITEILRNTFLTFYKLGTSAAKKSVPITHC